MIRMNRPEKEAWIAFVLFFPDEDRWDNNQGTDYYVRIPAPEGFRRRAAETLEEALEGEAGNREVLALRRFSLEDGACLGAVVSKGAEGYHLALLLASPRTLLLHWGMAKERPGQWLLPPASIWPPGTRPFDGSAVQTPFGPWDGRLDRIDLDLPEEGAPVGISFVLKEAESGRWLHDRGGDFFLPIRRSLGGDARIWATRLPDVVERIVAAETGKHSWTLMHRFRLCEELVDQVGEDPEGIALLYVWLRFSAIRQLAWQRNYNTKPRELSHAMDRLTSRLAGLYTGAPSCRGWVRLMFACVGRGGEGQRIRDEILEIMHRRHIKELSGHFLEEWHQKLHNNTTPDDIVICEAYLEFLRANGDMSAFYGRLEAGGVSRARIESYERPIRSAPDFVPHLRDGLIEDFEHFLATLKAVHAGVDLESAARAARPFLDDRCARTVESFLGSWAGEERSGDALVEAARRMTEARRRAKVSLDRGAEGVRELIFLDLALEGSIRTLIENGTGQGAPLDHLVELAGLALENFSISHGDVEIELCHRHWRVLSREGDRSGPDWALRMEALADRAERAAARFAAQLHECLQPKAELLGKAFGVEPWTIELFSEEVVRGKTMASTAARVFRGLDQQLRVVAGMKSWQGISPGEGTGGLLLVDELEAVEGRIFERPVLVLADRISGYEELPEGVAGIVSPERVDILSHLGIRLRNKGVPLATCHDLETLARLRSLEGRTVRLVVERTGRVRVREGGQQAAGTSKKEEARIARGVSSPRAGSSCLSCPLPLRRFQEGHLGGKSMHLKRLADGLPDWIHVPASVAIPFGVFEAAWKTPENRRSWDAYRALIDRVDEDPDHLLGKIRGTILSLEAPEGLLPSLHAAMAGEGLVGPARPEEAWSCIKRVWASLWNRRAFLSRKARGIAHDAVSMAVLIQELVEAEYAFVIHTADPVSGRRDEMLVEAVPGLGETLANNHPGSPLRISCPRGKDSPRILAYPSKATALRGKGLIFRSDSSAEDLGDYAGAGLYESVLLDPPRQILIDYTKEPLVYEGDFLRRFLEGITRVALEVEGLFGCYQDIEGAYAAGRFWVVQSRPQVGLEDPVDGRPDR